MALKCAVCNINEAKYKCPVCELRYCSIPCYKPHKASHAGDDLKKRPTSAEQLPPPTSDRPATKQDTAKVEFTDFEEDPDFSRLLLRYPSLHYQLQLVYGVTLEPGPEDGNSWSRRDWFPGDHQTTRFDHRDRGRGGRGRGRGRGRGGRFMSEPSLDARPRGPWTQEKANKQGLDLIQRMRETNDSELAEGMAEFVHLCQIKFERPMRSFQY